MLTQTYSAVLQGIYGLPITVEVDGQRGTPKLIIIGLPTKVVDEAKERITSALINCGVRIRSKRTVVNLAPADVKKNGTSLDLAIAVGILCMYREVPTLKDLGLIGELSLDGHLKPVKGIVSLVTALRRSGKSRIVIPKENFHEACLVKDVDILPVRDLPQLISLLKGHETWPKIARTLHSKVTNNFEILSSIRGHTSAIRALSIVAAGRHNILMVGPQGVGKSLLAHSLTELLPPLGEYEAELTQQIHTSQSIIFSGLRPPFRAPHHTITRIGLIGGGNQLKPGEITLAHSGVLFLDELSEFDRQTLEALRQPIETRQVALSKAQGQVTYPADFLLVAASNPCACGYLGSVEHTCRCSSKVREHYQNKFSGPFLDRIELQLFIPEIKSIQQTSFTKNQCQKMYQQILQARTIQRQRWHPVGKTLNSQASNKELTQCSQLESATQKLLDQAQTQLHFSMRSYFNTIKVAQTIADLETSSTIKPTHLLEALQYRQTQRH